MGCLARCTGKTGGRQRLTENRNPVLIVEQQGPEWNVIRAAREPERSMQHLTGTASNQVTGTRAGNRIRSVKEIFKS